MRTYCSKSGTFINFSKYLGRSSAVAIRDFNSSDLYVVVRLAKGFFSLARAASSPVSTLIVAIRFSI